MGSEESTECLMYYNVFLFLLYTWIFHMLGQDPRIVLSIFFPGVVSPDLSSFISHMHKSIVMRLLGDLWSTLSRLAPSLCSPISHTWVLLYFLTQTSQPIKSRLCLGSRFRTVPYKQPPSLSADPILGLILFIFLF